MAKDDYKKIVCLILSFLYARIRGKVDEKPEEYLQPMTKAFPVNEEYFYFILNEMVSKNLIRGIKFTKVWGGDIINISGMVNIEITGDGIEYLTENKKMREILEWFRDNAIALPGVIFTAMTAL